MHSWSLARELRARDDLPVVDSPEDRQPAEPAAGDEWQAWEIAEERRRRAAVGFLDELAEWLFRPEDPQDPPSDQIMS